MKKILIYLIILSSFAGCKKDAPAEFKPSTVEGLDLTFINTNFEAGAKTIYFTDESNGYIIDYKGSIYKSSDGAQSWVAQNSNNTLPLNDICFLNGQEGFVVGGESYCGGSGCVVRGAVMLHTANGGQTWNKVPLELSGKTELTSISFVNDSVGYAVGYSTFLSTKDRGITWKETIIDTISSLMVDVKFNDPKRGIIVCNLGKILRTFDGGETWTVSEPFDPGGTNKLNVVNEDLVFATSGYRIWKSVDFGLSWTQITEMPFACSQLIFRSDKVGYSFGIGEYGGNEFGQSYAGLNYTTDGGLNWKGNNMIHEMGRIESACSPTLNLAYAISGNVILKMRRL